MPLLDYLVEKHGGDTYQFQFQLGAEGTARLSRREQGGAVQAKIEAIPAALAPYQLELSEGGCELTYSYDTKGERTGITSLLGDLRNAGIRFNDIETRQSSLEDIFVSLVRAP